MMEITKLAVKKHVFVCVNEREEGDCCANINGTEIFFNLKLFVKENGLINDVWITRTRCLGFCNPDGTTLVIYPEGKWFMKTTIEDLDDIKKFLL